MLPVLSELVMLLVLATKIHWLCYQSWQYSQLSMFYIISQICRLRCQSWHYWPSCQSWPHCRSWQILAMFQVLAVFPALSLFYFTGIAQTTTDHLASLVNVFLHSLDRVPQTILPALSVYYFTLRQRAIGCAASPVTDFTYLTTPLTHQPRNLQVMLLVLSLLDFTHHQLINIESYRSRCQSCHCLTPLTYISTDLSTQPQALLSVLSPSDFTHLLSPRTFQVDATGRIASFVTICLYPSDNSTHPLTQKSAGHVASLVTI